jgi:hypothetical protein
MLAFRQWVAAKEAAYWNTEITYRNRNYVKLKDGGLNPDSGTSNY